MGWPRGNNVGGKNSRTHTKGKTEFRRPVRKPRNWKVREKECQIRKCGRGIERNGGLKFRRSRSDSDCHASNVNDKDFLVDRKRNEGITREIKNESLRKKITTDRRKWCEHLGSTALQITGYQRQS